MLPARRRRGEVQMRFQGHNVLAIVVAAIAIYLIGFLIYGLAFQEAWVAATGWSKAELETGMGKMPVGFIIPFLLAIGLSLAIKWRNASGWLAGARTGFLVALFFLLTQLLYGYTYAPAGGETLLGIDAMHAFLTASVGGAILGAWK